MGPAALWWHRHPGPAGTGLAPLGHGQGSHASPRVFIFKAGFFGALFFWLVLSSFPRPATLAGASSSQMSPPAPTGQEGAIQACPYPLQWHGLQPRLFQAHAMWQLMSHGVIASPSAGANPARSPARFRFPSRTQDLPRTHVFLALSKFEWLQPAGLHESKEGAPSLPSAPHSQHGAVCSRGWDPPGLGR